MEIFDKNNKSIQRFELQWKNHDRHLQRTYFKTIEEANKFIQEHEKNNDMTEYILYSKK